MKYITNLDNVASGYDFIGSVALLNRCCEGRPVIITRSHGLNVYSCQCECGLWCTTGRTTIDDAMIEWQKMTDHYDEEQIKRHMEEEYPWREEDIDQVK